MQPDSNKKVSGKAGPIYTSQVLKLEKFEFLELESKKNNF